MTAELRASAAEARAAQLQETVTRTSAQLVELGAELTAANAQVVNPKP